MKHLFFLLALYPFVAQAQTTMNIGNELSPFFEEYTIKPSHMWAIISMDDGCHCKIKKPGILVPQAKLVTLPLSPGDYHLTIDPFDSSSKPLFVGGSFPFMVMGGSDGSLIDVICSEGNYVKIVDMTKN